MQKRDGPSIAMPSMVGIVSRQPAVHEKVWCFFCSNVFLFFCFFCFFVTLWNHEVCINGNAMKQWNFQNSYGTVAHRKDSSSAPILKFLYGPTRFFLRGKFIPKIAIFGDFGGRKATFLKPQKWKLEWLWVRGRPSPSQILYKKNA